VVQVFAVGLLLTAATSLASPLPPQGPPPQLPCPPPQTPPPAPLAPAPRGNGCKKGHEKDCPVKTKHSKAEVLWVAGVIQLLNPGATVSVNDVIRALVNGDKCSLSDARVGNIVLEYDEAYWHHDVGRDERKMQTLERRNDLNMIVRLRRGKCPKLTIAGRTLVVLVHTDSNDTTMQLKATVDAINAAQEVTTLTFGPKAMKDAVRTGAEAYKEIDKRTTAMVAALTTRYGKGAGRIFKVHGVKSRLLNAAFVEKLDQVYAMCENDATRMGTFMRGGSVAAALAGPDAEQFFQSVERLRAMGIEGKGLDTFMCDGVASRLVGPKADVDALFAALGRLQTDLGCKVPNMVTLMSDGLARAIVGPKADAFFELLLLIKTTVCGNNVKKMCTFTSGSVASAMADDPKAFGKALERLERDFAVKNGLLVTFMGNSAMLAMLDEDADVFWTALHRLDREFGIRGQRLATFMCDGVAKFIMEDADRFFAMLEKLDTEFDISDQLLVTFMCDGVAKFILEDAECFFEVLKKLNKDFGIRDQRLATFMCDGVAAFIREGDALFFKMLEKLKADFKVVDLVPFVNNSLSSAARGPKSEVFWVGMEQLKGELGEGGLASIMCGGVASSTSSPEWVHAVLGVLHLTSAACVRALVYYSPVVNDAPAVHKRLQLAALFERKRFADKVCKGADPVKPKRVREWLDGN